MSTSEISAKLEKPIKKEWKNRAKAVNHLLKTGGYTCRIHIKSSSIVPFRAEKFGQKRGELDSLVG